jgi:hypothetical protein
VREREIEGEREIKKKIICGKSSHVSKRKESKFKKHQYPPLKRNSGKTHVNEPLSSGGGRAKVPPNL